MKINWMEYENKRHVLAWFLLEAMSEAGIDLYDGFDPQELEVILTINGVETPITGPMEFLQSQLDDIAEKGFKEGREEATRLLHNKIFDWLEEVENED